MPTMTDEDFATDHCPNDNHSTFNLESNRSVHIYKCAGSLRPPGKINSEMRKLRKAIAGLSLDTIQVLVAREGEPYRNSGAKTYLNFLTRVNQGNTAVPTLERLVAKDLKRSVRGDGQARDEFVVNAISTYSIHGGKISAKFRSGFIGYLEALAESAGIAEIDAPKALRTFLNRSD
jgi:hypothetical protein